MDVTSTGPRIGSLVRAAIALTAAIMLLLSLSGGASSTGPFDLTGVTCMDLYLDQTSPPPTKGLPHETGDLLATKILSRIEPSASQEGAWDVTSVAYSGPGTLIPTKPPSAETCGVKGDGNELHAELAYLPVSNDRPTAIAKVVQKGSESNLDYTICQFEPDLGTSGMWVRSEFSIVVDGKPVTQDFGVLIATLNVSAPSNPEDPTSCGTTGSVFNVILESTARVDTKGIPQAGVADDWDNDGCTDWDEMGTDETKGGLRDPFNPWDHYDVNGDGVIDLLNDILGVIDHWAPTGAPPYDVAFDRGPVVGLNNWNLTAPDGVIDLLNDILGVIDQFQHNCTAA